MRAYEYIRLGLDMGDLSELNRFSRDGWHVAGVVKDAAYSYWALLERPCGDVGDTPVSHTPYQAEAEKKS
jgi:hypothetical protein